jgi:hypothetical protein
VGFFDTGHVVPARICFHGGYPAQVRTPFPQLSTKLI